MPPPSPPHKRLHKISSRKYHKNEKGKKVRRNEEVIIT